MSEEKIYLSLAFRNAKLIRTHSSTKDRISVFGNISRVRDLTNNPNFKEPITRYQISNMLHVLFGERPVNTLRGSNYSSQEWINDLAMDSYIKYSNIHSVVNEYGRVFTKETVQINKSAYNSYARYNINWEVIKNYTDGHFGWVLKEISIATGIPNPRKVPFDIVLEKLRNEIDTPPVITLLTKIKGTFGIAGLSSYIEKPADRGIGIIKKDINNNGRGTSKGVNRSYDSAEFFSGEIIVPLTIDQVKIIKENYNGSATILDGGVININHITNDVQLEGFTKVSDISTEKDIKDENKNKLQDQ